MDFVIFSSITWDDQGGAHRPTQFAHALARLGHRCLFIQVPAAPARPNQPRVELTSLVELGLPESDIRRAWFGFDDADLEPVARNLDSRLDRFESGAKRIALWAIPFVPFVRLFPLMVGRGYATVYDCIDEFSGLNEFGRHFANVKAEWFLALHVDLITALSKPLVDKFRAMPVPRVEPMPNGADLSFRAREPAPQDLLRGDVTLGFWGTIADDFIDVGALCYVARERPRWAINLIGAYDLDRTRPSVAASLQNVPNVRLLGHRPHDVLMNYLTGMDVCLMPFPDSAFSRGRDPIKANEYIAGYKPVVGLHTSQVAGLPYFSVAESAPEFLEQIEAARAVRVDKQVVDDFLLANSWDARADYLLKLAADLQPESAGPKRLTLPDRFEDPGTIATRMAAYVAHLEQTADERLAYIRELEGHARQVEAYLKRLERTHPLVWLKRLLGWRPGGAGKS